MGFDFSTIIQRIILSTPGILLAVVVHEFAHGYVAYRLGDPTAKLMGRLTLNPISHLDPFGTLAFVLTGMIGWAKPVPVDPRYLRNPRRDMLWISLAGPGANLVAAVVVAMLIHLIVFGFSHSASPFTRLVIVPFFSMLEYALKYNVGLAIFNLIPIPPLDGSKILAGLLPREQAYKFEQLGPYGFIVLFALILSGMTSYIVGPPFQLIMGLLLFGLA
jgi:Zn-dependent protease